MKEGQDSFSRARLEAIFKAYDEGKTSYEEIEKAKKNAEARVIEKIGASSERKFFNFTKKEDCIEFAQHPLPLDDAKKGVDAWVRFKSYQNLPDLPVQIKSSYKDVRKLREEVSYKRRHGMIIGLNCGPIVSFEDIGKQLGKEIKRIKNLIREDPSITKYI